MSELKKWYIGVYGGEAQARPCSPAEFEIIRDRDRRYFVIEDDFDRVVAERDALQVSLNEADEGFDLAKTLLRETVAVLRGGDCYGWEDNQADAIDKFLGEDALKPAECDHSYHHFGTEQPRRRCNLCNKLEPMSSAQVAAFNDDNDHRPERDE